MALTTQMFRYEGTDGTGLAGFRWAGEAPPKAVIQLSHGAGEHSARYLEPLAPIIEAGYLVYAADHRGHGLTSGTAHFGDFGPGGAQALVDDMAVLARRARAENPGLPLILFGHSMGAMLAQAWLPEHAELIDALVLSGTAAPGERVTPGRLNDGFEGRTDYDWLSRDTAEVDKYIADPFCKIRFKPQSMESFQTLRERSISVESLAKVRKGLPVYVLVGDADPVNDHLKRVAPLIEVYRAAGLAVTFKVYPGGRHEMLNETNRDEVVADLAAWLDGAVASLRRAA